jgi:hypothetical protein
MAAVTGTVTVQDPPAWIEPAVKVTDEVPVVTAPPQVVLAAPAINMPEGKVSVSGADAFRNAVVVPALLSVMVSVATPPALTVAGLKALPSVGAVGGWGTVKVATAGAALLPFWVTRAPAAKELM